MHLVYASLACSVRACCVRLDFVSAIVAQQSAHQQHLIRRQLCFVLFAARLFQHCRGYVYPQESVDTAEESIRIAKTLFVCMPVTKSS